MNSNIRIVNPLHYPEWDNLLLSTAESTFFHSKSWCNVLAQSYGYKPNYFLKAANGRPSILIPFMEINTRWSQTRGVSLPFSDFCHPIVAHGTQFKEILDTVLQHAKTAGWKYVEFRGGSNHFNGAAPFSLCYEHQIDLKNDENELLASFRKSTKRNIKKALKEDVKVKIDNSFDSLKEFYQLNCLTRRDHGLPPQPFSFFKKVYDEVISQEKGFVALASYQNNLIAAAVYFHFAKRAIYKYGASDKKYQNLRANNLVMWEAIKWYALRGYENFSFGKTDPEHHGLLQFKRGWGTRETAVYYYRYDLKSEKFITSASKDSKFNDIARKLPIVCLRLAGSLLYKHVG